MRFSAHRQRPPLDLSFFLRYGKPEQDAVAAFDFLEEISTSGSTDHLDTTDGVTRRSRSSSQPLSREVVMREMQTKRQQQQQPQVDPAARNTRPWSETDFRNFHLVPHPGVEPGHHQQNRYPSYYSCSLLNENRGRSDLHSAGGGATGSTPPPRKHKVRRRKKRSDMREKGQKKEGAVSQVTEAGGKGAGTRTGRGSKGKRGGERMRREWHDIKVGDVVTNTLSLSDSCCDSSSSPSPPSLSYTDLSRF